MSVKKELTETPLPVPNADKVENEARARRIIHNMISTTYHGSPEALLAHITTLVGDYSKEGIGDDLSLSDFGKNASPRTKPGTGKEKVSKGQARRAKRSRTTPNVEESSAARTQGGSGRSKVKKTKKKEKPVPCPATLDTTMRLKDAPIRRDPGTLFAYFLPLGAGNNVDSPIILDNPDDSTA
ncbi:hypothetical protein D9611_009165 [Ephemerocybe angulata]|uniref:Uncharacterized protein n=1 Tax=Ephemerocybe angulata TaxID=980116 RepID=A0A8H5FJU7_9AGAR|nr:hypothetical protein D9611_009165 [Tulosesus angulatus]